MDVQLAQIATRQDGLISTSDLRARSFSARARAKLVSSGWLVLIAPNVYAVAGAPDTHRRRLRAGLLSLGEHSWVSYEASAALHRLDRSRTDAVEFTVPRAQRRHSRQFRVHTTQWMPPIDRVEIDGLRATSAARTIIDLAHARAHPARVEAAIDSAIRLGLSAPHALARRLETLRGSGRWGCRLIDRLLEDSGGHSPLERRFLELIRTAGLPRPKTQAVFKKGNRHIARVDFFFEAAKVVIEVTGRLGHVSDAERMRDAQRRNELQDLGLTVYEYTSTEVFDHPGIVADSVRERLAASCPHPPSDPPSSPLPDPPPSPPTRLW